MAGGAAGAARVGLIANPASGKDIRRLTAYGSVVDNEGKVALVRRILLGMKAVGTREVLYLPDYYGIVPRAYEGLSREDRAGLHLSPVPVPLTGTPEDSTRGAAFLAAEGAKCIVVVGGDGTNRVVARGTREVPLLPVSTGTNNVFPYQCESTLAGIAAGLAARGLLGEGCFFRAKVIEVFRGGERVDLALIDAAVLRGPFVGARAVWDPGELRRLVLTCARPGCLGLSSIGASLAPLSHLEEGGLVVEFGRGQEVLAPIAPGLVCAVTVKGWRKLRFGEEVKSGPGPAVVALDGEREIELLPGEELSLVVSSRGPLVLDLPRALEEAARKRLLWL
ncbi:MAG: NAD(+)/NADH kinase [Desulfotomaculales bacterium]